MTANPNSSSSEKAKIDGGDGNSKRLFVVSGGSSTKLLLRDLELTRGNAATSATARPAKQRAAAARAALARVFAAADPGDLPCLPDATRVERGPVGGRRFPWSIALQFAAARDLAVLARTHRAARSVCERRATLERIVKARHGRGCKRASDKRWNCKCGGCARVALMLGPATATAPSRLDAGAADGSPCWLRRVPPPRVPPLRSGWWRTGRPPRPGGAESAAG